MRSSRLINSLTNQHQQQSNASNNSNNGSTSPICRCRVMYLGSSVPHITKDGLQGIQEPLRELYPDKTILGEAGIDSWLSVWSNGILIENVDDTGREVKRFFKIDALHYCAAVKFVPTPINRNTPTNEKLPKFLPLDSPYARQPSLNPPVFACILRRTTGIKVLECHAFICKREAAANALVRCCFHAYADTMYAKQMGTDVNSIPTDINNNVTHQNSLESQYNVDANENDSYVAQSIASRRSKSIAALNESDSKKLDSWKANNGNNYARSINGDQQDRNQMIRRKSMNENYALNCDTNQIDLNRRLVSNGNLMKQQKLSKSMHHLNQSSRVDHMVYGQIMKEQANELDGFPSNQSTSASCINAPNGRWASQESRMIQVPQPFYSPYGARVPSYPPQDLINSTNNGGTMRSIKSMAANSIASTLLRSKKHAKAMSMAQLDHDKVTSFHQSHSNASTMGGPMLFPPVPPMFMANMPIRPFINGSQTMKAPSRSMVPMMGPSLNFEAMTPKEMKKLLKKSAKYGLDPTKFGENGLPLLPLRPPTLARPFPISPQSKSGTMVSQSMMSEIYSNDMPDISALQYTSPSRVPVPNPMEQPPLKPILVKPNPEFLKSKAGKKWLKQQKEFKKLLPPHLDGLPIVFGPPPVEAIDPSTIPNNNIQMPTFLPPHPVVPIMDSSGYYNPNPFYGQNGRASAASTLIRYSPHTLNMHEAPNGLNGLHHDNEYQHRNHVIYNNVLDSSSFAQGHREYLSDESSMMLGNNECGIDAIQGLHPIDARHRHQKRNLMVEQSVISLGDENDYEDEETEGQNFYGDNQVSEIESYTRKSKVLQSGPTNNIHRDRNDDHYRGDQVSYDQILTDDQSSYSSGIYKRGHINERAFSYSIRQERKSSENGNSDNEYAAMNETVPENQSCHNNQQHANNMYQSKRDRNDIYYQNNVTKPLPVNELTARLENQLNMKSFANSTIESHM